jgi:hypothetical protein
MIRPYSCKRLWQQHLFLALCAVYAGQGAADRPGGSGFGKAERKRQRILIVDEQVRRGAIPASFYLGNPLIDE